MHPSLPYVGLLLGALAVGAIGAVAMSNNPQEASVKAEEAVVKPQETVLISTPQGPKKVTVDEANKMNAPVWKTRRVLRGSQYVEEKYRELTPADIDRQRQNAREAMRDSGRL